VAYVELIGENSKPVYQTKIALKNGIGYGDFFIPATLPTGNYRVVAYTKWMKNFPPSEFFHAVITIVNPFLVPDEIGAQKNPPSNTQMPAHNAEPADEIKISLAKKQFSVRERIALDIENKDSINEITASINVRLLEKPFYTADPRIKAGDPVIANATQSFRYIPDLRGELILGRVVNKRTKEALAGEVVYLTAPSKNFTFEVTQTDSLGRFLFSTDNLFSATLLFQLASASINDFEIELGPQFLDRYEDFTPPPFSIDSSFREMIERRNLYSQIENAYYEVKKDSIPTDAENTPFFGTPDKIYLLDDYVRFTTMEDIFREYIPEVVLRKKNDHFELQLVNSINSLRLTGAPLILLDGIPILDADVVMNYNPLYLQRIEIVARKYFYSVLQTDGIISMRTYDGNAKGLPTDKLLQRVHSAMQPPKIYYTPSYSLKTDSRVPDFRIQLLWESTIVLGAAKTKNVSFFTSDVTGTFVITVSGFTRDGRYVQKEDVIEVTEKK
jgi:hypothetical protein